MTRSRQHHQRHAFIALVALAISLHPLVARPVPGATPARVRNVLGVHAIADGAGEMMLAATYAIKFGLTVEQLADTWAPYLTMSEGLKLTAQSFHRDIKQLSCCAA